jgi:Zn-dependent protease with chaperone function
VSPVNAVLDVRYFDGRSSRPRAAQLRVADGRLHIAPPIGAPDGFDPFAVPLGQVHWPERTRHGGRLAALPDGASVQALDVADWDAWCAAAVPRRESGVVRAQQSWQGVAVALVLLLAAIAGLYQWGLPWLATGVTALVPHRVDALIGAQALASLDESLLQPSALPADEQARIREAFTRMVVRAHPDGAPPWQLQFRRGRDDKLGPNALALPGGTVVLTDELVKLLPPGKDGDDAVLGVLGHEFGHVRQRHTMRQLVQASAIGFAVSVAFGDYGTLIGTAPVLLATLGYSRDAEREADEESVRLMRAVGISPRAMAGFFEAVERWRGARQRGGRQDDPIGMAFATHPATAERIDFFKAAAE